MDPSSSGINVQLLLLWRRTIKGQAHILPTVHSPGICLTPDTFHSDSTSCPTRAARPLETFHQSLFFFFTRKTWKSPKQQQPWVLQPLLTDIIHAATELYSHHACIKHTLQNQLQFNASIKTIITGSFFFVPLTSAPSNPHIGQRAWWGMAGWGIRVPVRRTCYPKALEELYSRRSQTIISQTHHAYVRMRLSTSVTPHKQLA